MVLGVEVLCGVWGPVVMLPTHRSLPVLPDNTGPGEPHLAFKEKRFWLHLAKLLRLALKKKRKKEGSKPLKMQFKTILKVQKSPMSGLKHSP